MIGYNKITDEEYFKIDALSNSFLKQFHKSPAHAFIKTEPTQAMIEGTMIHEYILQPEVFAEKYMVIPKIDKRTKEYKEISESAGNKIIIFQDDVQVLEQMKQSVYSRTFENQTLGDIIDSKESDKELSMQFEMLDEQCKGKIDLKYKNIIFDLKKITDCNEIKKHVNNFGYHRQYAFYKHGADSIDMNENRFIFIFIENVAPFGCKLIELDDEYYTKGLNAITKDIMAYKSWKAFGSDKTKVYDDKIEILNCPAWLED